MPFSEIFEATAELEASPQARKRIVKAYSDIHLIHIAAVKRIY
jgi:hypothetical protein